IWRATKRAAVLAASPASFQPSSATRSVGSSREGRTWKRSGPCCTLLSLAAPSGACNRGPASADELVTVPADGEDVARPRRIGLHVAAQPRHEAVDHAG